MKPINGNVMDKKAYRKRVTQVVRYISDCVGRTLGPCGHTALIQTADSVVATKDGWNVSRAISLDNIVDNSIKSMIESCQQSVVLKVGDGVFGEEKKRVLNGASFFIMTSRRYCCVLFQYSSSPRYFSALFGSHFERR